MENDRLTLTTSIKLEELLEKVRFFDKYESDLVLSDKGTPNIILYPVKTSDDIIRVRITISEFDELWRDMFREELVAYGKTYKFSSFHYTFPTRCLSHDDPLKKYFILHIDYEIKSLFEELSDKFISLLNEFGIEDEFEESVRLYSSKASSLHEMFKIYDPRDWAHGVFLFDLCNLSFVNTLIKLNGEWLDIIEKYN